MSSPTSELLRPDVVELIRAGSYRELREALRILDPADIAELLTDLLDEHGPEDAAVAYRVLPRADASEVFSHLEPEDQEQLIEELGAERAIRVVEDMHADDRVRLLDELPIEVTRRILRSLRPDTRKQTQAILGYGPETVGRLMTPDYVKLRPHWTIRQALEHIRRYGKDAETIHWVYVVATDSKLIDDVHIRRLLIADPDDPIETLMDGRYVALNATDDREEAVRALNRYDRAALPVVDGLGLLIGIVTYDDVADVAEEEATEDFHKQGGLEALDQPYLSTRLWSMLKKRGGWLAGLFLMQLLTIGVMTIFDDALEKAVVLAVFVPLIISSGGNTGTQAASLIVRALALDEVSPGDWVGILRRELLTGLALGSILGVMGLGVVIGAHLTGLASTEYAARVAFVVGTAIVGIVIWGSLAGSLLPLVLRRLNIDPATSSSPLVATLMDVSGLTIYFVVAVAVLKGTLL